MIKIKIPLKELQSGKYLQINDSILVISEIVKQLKPNEKDSIKSLTLTNIDKLQDQVRNLVNITDNLKKEKE